MNHTYRILILDDEPIVGERLKKLLEKDGYEVESFVEPMTALQRLEEKPFDIVVSDIRMRDMDGIEVMNAVRQKSARIKVILITGYATLELARESLTKGAYDFIAKPFKSSEIRSTIQKAVEALDQDQQQLSETADI